jgi:hypothetical protein
VEHLQGSLHSALQDLREILGLGRVYSGFEVIPSDEQAITIQPGLAFDFEKNRIACDEPKTLEVAFAPEEETQYVCIKYDQVEDGQMEGQFTLIWDSCAILLRATLPEPKENLIPIAKLVKSVEAEKAFEIISLIQPEASEKPENFEMGKPEEAGLAEGSESNEATGETEPDWETKASAEGAAMPDMEAESEVESLSALASQPETRRLRVRQGVVRLAPEPGSSDYLSIILLEPLRRKLSSKESSNGELLFALAEKEVTLDFPISSLACQTIISGDYGMVEDGMASEAAATTAGNLRLSFQATAQGEATFSNDEKMQFGVSTMRFYPRSGPAGMSYCTAELTERGVAHLSSEALPKVSENENLGEAWEVLQHLQFLIMLHKTNDRGFKLICHLIWKGEITEEIIRKIATRKFDFKWETLVAWKALGESAE